MCRVYGDDCLDSSSNVRTGLDARVACSSRTCQTGEAPPTPSAARALHAPVLRVQFYPGEDSATLWSRLSSLSKRIAASETESITSRSISSPASWFSSSSWMGLP